MRIEKLRLTMNSQGIELFVIQERRNISYFTAIDNIFGHLFIHLKGKPEFYVINKQFQQALDLESSSVNLTAGQPDYEDHLFDELVSESKGLKRVAFDTLDCMNYRRIVKSLKIEPVFGNSMISSIQRFYDEEEMKLVQKAASIADACFETVRETIRPGVTELEVIGQMQYTLRREGSEWDTFIVFGSGLNTAYCEPKPNNRVIQHGDIVFIDIGPTYRGYMADISRTFMVGKPNSRQKKILDSLVEVEFKATKLSRLGVKAEDIDAQVRKLVTEKGFSDYLHHTGHSLGGAFQIVPGSQATLEEGDVICLEPGIYVPGVGGGRIEDQILITKDSQRLMSHANRDPYINV